MTLSRVEILLNVAGFAAGPGPNFVVGHFEANSNSHCSSVRDRENFWPCGPGYFHAGWWFSTTYSPRRNSPQVEDGLPPRVRSATHIVKVMLYVSIQLEIVTGRATSRAISQILGRSSTDHRS